MNQNRNWKEHLYAVQFQAPIQMLSDTRTDWSISALRLVAMCCIIACHLCQLYELEAAWWLNSAVQVFLFISGWLFGLRSDIDDIKKWIGKRFKRICVPFWLTVCLILLLDCIFSIKDTTLDKIILALLCVRSGSIPNGAHLWYVSAILLCYLITPLLSALWKHWGAAPLAVVTVLFGICGGFIVHNGFWCADYILAFLFARFVRDGAPETRLLWIMCIAAGVGCFIAVICCPILGISPSKPVHFLAGPFCFSVVRLLLGMERFQPPEFLRKLLRWDDNYSYEVYLMHNVLILGDFSLALTFPDSPCIVIIASVLWSLIAASVLHRVSQLCYKLIDKLKERASRLCA